MVHEMSPSHPWAGLLDARSWLSQSLSLFYFFFFLEPEVRELKVADMGEKQAGHLHTPRQGS